MTSVEYVLKKVLAFVFIFFLSGVIGEGVIIAVSTSMGYDPLHGDIPTGQFFALIILCGYLIYSIVALLYCKIFEKRGLKDIGFCRKGSDYLPGILIAIIMLAIVVATCCLTGSFSFESINTNIDLPMFFYAMVAYIIQGSEEEILCRGFLMGSLQKKLSVPMAIFISSSAFVAPHLLMTGLLDSGALFATIGIINLYLISILFSVLMLWRKNIWINCGLHTAWNFILSMVLGLTVSGNEAESEGLLLFHMNKADVINGSVYGIEAGLATSIVTIVMICVIIYLWKGRDAHGIQ